MKKIKLTKYERDIVKEVEKGNFKTVGNFVELKKQFQEVARNTLTKMRKEELE